MVIWPQLWYNRTVKTIRQTYLINSPISKVWKALVDPKQIDAWGGGPSKMSDEVGFKFTLWGSQIFGKNLLVSKHKKLVQEWWSGKDRWDEPSTTTFSLSEENGKTKLELVHENVPEKNAKDINSGWKDFYLGPLKQLLEQK